MSQAQKLAGPAKVLAISSCSIALSAVESHRVPRHQYCSRLDSQQVLGLCWPPSPILQETRERVLREVYPAPVLLLLIQRQPTPLNIYTPDAPLASMLVKLWNWHGLWQPGGLLSAGAGMAQNPRCWPPPHRHICRVPVSITCEKLFRVGFPLAVIKLRKDAGRSAINPAKRCFRHSEHRRLCFSFFYEEMWQS